jgi:hypothetical protein
VIVIVVPLDFLITGNSATSCADISRICFVAAVVVHQILIDDDETRAIRWRLCGAVGVL